ncbi:MAG: SIMPL domain-containing protein [Chloroflexi bacterium]|nr:SIMPL domain-containing protein [Chloroflexota bacterium]
MSRIILAATGIFIAAVLVASALALLFLAPTRGGQSVAGLTSTGLAQAAQNAQAGGNTISVSGEGVVLVKPDLAQLQIGVETTDPSLNKAEQDNASAMNSVISKLKEMGIKEEDIQTTSFDVSPVSEYDGKQEVQTGFRVTNVVLVKVKPVDKSGSIIDEVVKLGANQVFGISFSVDDPASLQAEARDKAVKDARSKAEQLAKSAGVTLGSAVSITDYATTPVGPLYRVNDVSAAPQGAGGPPPVQTGQLEVRVDVQVSYAIQ